MFPPKIWTESGYLWKQSASTEPVTRIDVLHVQQRLNDALYTYKARETGICPIRRDLYDKCFQEIIREVTVTCAEQGLLLYRIRNETLMTLKAYETVYESLVAFNFRKTLSLKNKLKAFEESLTAVKEQNVSLKKQLNSANEMCEHLEIEYDAKVKLFTSIYDQRINELKSVISKQKMLIESLTQPNDSVTKLSDISN
ncbi:33 kDa inner dynein arm light chain: axonemal-like protein [Leptotrombidium deliense]|uniref:33 kDa inner dynein arm light chain: axonemal-like protein n=1 Tax=Leptotrombidium deliense TaxID=299467 RepID=A0A443RZ99_9ACAR|nr:33 kDa inner dynein arm light chain: axonemal-like protein [Leptotrombidium deliense]